MRTFACAALLLALPLPALAQDADGDGVPNGADAFPCAAGPAGLAFAPAEGVYGTLLFEDEWPQAGDQDLNDLVLDYSYEVVTDAQGRALSIRARYHVAALGGVTPLGLGLHLPVPAAAVAQARLTDPNGTQDLVAQWQDAEATYVLSADLSALATAPPPFNVASGAPAEMGVTLTVDVELATPTTIAMSEAPFDVYVFRADQVSHETHRTPYAGTGRFYAPLLGTGADGSANGRYFVDTQGLPFILDVPASAAYPVEGEHVAALWPAIVDFAASGGATAQAFYASPVPGARFDARVAAPAIPPRAIDTSCVPTGSYPAPGAYSQLWHVATNGDDATGDGSEAAPFASLHVAVAAAQTGDGIQIHPGVYRTTPQIHYPGYMTAGIWDAGKRLAIFGANDQTILEVHAADASLRDAHAVSLEGPADANGVGSVLSNLVVHFYPNRGTNYSNAIFGWGVHGAEIRNVVFENRGDRNWAYIYDNRNPYDTPRFINSAFISNGRWTTRYTGRPSFINCLFEDAPRYSSVLRNNVIRRASGADLGGGALADDVRHAGDPNITNPDGSRSHIGPRGGLYAWP